MACLGIKVTKPADIFYLIGNALVQQNLDFFNKIEFVDITYYNVVTTDGAM